jgi:two-component system, OmpR family, sensor histidine kinase KdpD
LRDNSQNPAATMLHPHLPARQKRGGRNTLAVCMGLASACAAAALTLRPQGAGISPSRKDPAGHEAQSLCDLVRESAQLDLHQKPGPQMAALIRSIFGLEAVAVFDADLNEVYPTGEWFADLEETVRNICVFGTVRDDPETGLIRRVLRVGNMPIGALLVRGELCESTSNTIAALIAITFDRYHSLANEMRMESEKRAEQLRTTVLDSLAHAYKTPLTAIRAASTGLIEMGGLNAAQSGLVSLIEEQAEELNGLTTRLLQTARLESQTLRPERVAVAPLIEDVVAGTRDQLAGFSVKVAVARENLTVVGDRGVLRAMLTQFVENAGKYGDAGTTVTIEAAEQPAAVLLSVHNRGPVIPASDHERIFDRYFRCTATEQQAPGSGIGLSVARQAALAHGGDVWVTSDPVTGTTFFASLPNVHRGAEA